MKKSNIETLQTEDLHNLQNDRLFIAGKSGKLGKMMLPILGIGS